MVQVGSPYEGMGAVLAGDLPEDEEARNVKALDLWIERIRAKYANAKAEWSGEVKVANGANGAGGASSARSPRWQRMMTLLQAGMRQEMAKFGDGSSNGNAPTITARFVQMDDTQRNDESAISALLRQMWIERKRRDGLPDMIIDSLVSSMDDESILLEIEQMLK